jgi:hypothetical protein
MKTLARSISGNAQISTENRRTASATGSAHDVGIILSQDVSIAVTQERKRRETKGNEGKPVPELRLMVIVFLSL